MMRNRKTYTARQIGFMLGGNPASPFQPNPMMPPTTPFAGGSPPPMFGSPAHPPLGGMMGQQPGGLGGLLQGLLGGGGGSLDLPSLLANAQKMIGAVNQAGEVFKNISPMLQLFRNIDLSDLLSDSDTPAEEEEAEQPKPKRRKKGQKRTRTKAKKRKKSA
jgi:hypothetical protein